MTRVKHSFASLAVCLTVCFREYGQLFTPAEILEGSNRVYGQVMLRVSGLRSPFMSSLSLFEISGRGGMVGMKELLLRSKRAAGRG